MATDQVSEMRSVQVMALHWTLSSQLSHSKLLRSRWRPKRRPARHTCHPWTNMMTPPTFPPRVAALEDDSDKEEGAPPVLQSRRFLSPGCFWPLRGCLCWKSTNCNEFVVPFFFFSSFECLLALAERQAAGHQAGDAEQFLEVSRSPGCRLETKRNDW